MDKNINCSVPLLSTTNKGFTLFELMIATALIGILSAIAMPGMNDFLIKMRVDNEISEMQRLLLTARSLAINTGKNTTVCPLESGSCTTSWGGEISVFTNDANTLANGTAFGANDELVKIKEAIKAGDKFQFATTSVIYTPTGRLLTPAVAASFSYCPYAEAEKSRGIDLSVSGRSYTSSDTDDDDKDEDRNGNEIVCS